MSSAGVGGCSGVATNASDAANAEAYLAPGTGQLGCLAIDFTSTRALIAVRASATSSQFTVAPTSLLRMMPQGLSEYSDCVVTPG